MIRGDNYPPPSMRALLAQALSFLKMVFIACIVLGQNPFVWLNINTPSIYSWALENKVSVSKSIFIVVSVLPLGMFLACSLFFPVFCLSL